ncbi:MAG: biotin--[acetyl-CoA-carboxylase] ligase [Alphaproteobacteria bacterium]|nr:biotin--[acetyl-CoA-carboxylase] ligase [Alphaproteobacteria bacterium]
MNYKLYSFDKIPSTQTYAHELVAKGGAVDRTIILAAAQSAGRGRYRRTWVSHHGNLYASFIYKAVARDPRLSYCVAVAVAETLISFDIKPQIKWPNDILVEGKKICGILTEYSKNFVIIGIGINIKTNPTVTAAYETTKMDNYKRNRGMSVEFTRDEVLSVLVEKMDFWLSHLANGNFVSIRARWMQLAAGLDSEIMYKGQPATLCEINLDGALVLRRLGEYILVLGDEIMM